MPERDILKIIIKKPASKLNYEIDINYSNFFANLGKMAVAGVTTDIDSFFEHGIEALKEIGLKNKPEQVAWLLISKALFKALVELIDDYKDLFLKKPNELELQNLAKHVDDILATVEVSVDVNFFKQPQNLPFLKDFKSAMDFWLEGFGWDKAQQTAFYFRLESYFVFSLDSIWINDPDSYKVLEEFLYTPFTQATVEQRCWIQYNNSLQKLANDRVFNETFSLKQIYVPLNAYYEEIDREKDQKIKVAFDLHEKINDWITHFDRNDTLKVIRGKPGCGKSSFSKMLAADIARKGDIPVLFIPLQHFNISDDLLEAVEKFISYDGFLNINPLDLNKGQKRLLIIFDGLDELSMQGQAATAQAFVDEVIRALDRFNSNTSIKRQAIITGRDLSVQASQQCLRKTQQVFHILPYFIDSNKQKEYEDRDNRLSIDLRNIWWENFSKATGSNYPAIPEVLRQKNLTPINREPLLNYLVALSFQKKGVQFNKNTKLNSIYESLLKAVYKRQWEINGQYKIARHLEEQQFTRILEEIALVIWHGNGTTASKHTIYQHCKRSHLSKYLEKLSNDSEKGVVQLLTTFYFREFDKKYNRNLDPIFEFTHKSFGEYLTAKRIIRTVKDIQEEVERHNNDPDKGYNIRKALEVWVKICGRNIIDKYLFNFIQDEISIYPIKDIRKWQITFAHMLSSSARKTIPMERLAFKNFHEMVKQSRNAEEGMLAIHHACFKKTQTVLSIDWGNKTAFIRWWKRIQSYISGVNNPLLDDLLLGLNIKEYCLNTIDFRNTNLRRMNFEGTHLKSANLESANLEGANLEDACLDSANLERANLKEAHLEGASLEGVNLKEANLRGAFLEGSFLEGSYLKRVNLKEAKLKGSNLKGVNLENANLKNAYMEKSNLEGSYLEGVNLEGSNLEGAFLYGTNLRRTNLRKSNLRGANLQDADLREANLQDADLREANLRGANLDGADLRNTKIS